MRGYIAIVKTVPGGGYRALFPDLPGCHALGRTIEDALAQAKSALKAYGAQRVRTGLPLPVPRGSS